MYYIPREVAPPPKKTEPDNCSEKARGLGRSKRGKRRGDNQRVSGKLAVPKLQCRSNAQVSLGHTVVSKCCKDHAWYPARLVPSRDTEPR